MESTYPKNHQIITGFYLFQVAVGGIHTMDQAWHLFRWILDIDGVRFCDSKWCHVVCNSAQTVSDIMDKMGISWAAHRTSFSLDFFHGFWFPETTSYCGWAITKKRLKHVETCWKHINNGMQKPPFSTGDLDFAGPSTSITFWRSAWPGHGIVSVLGRPQGRQNLEILRRFGSSFWIFPWGFPSMGYPIDAGPLDGLYWQILDWMDLDGFGWIWGIPHFRKPPWHIQPKIPVVVGWLLMVTVTYGRSSFSRGWSETCFIWWLEPSQRHDNLELWFCCNVATQRVFQKIMALMQPMKYDDVWLLLTYNLCRCSHVVITILPWLFHTAIVSFCRRSFNHWTNGSASARPQREQLQ